MAKCIIIWRLFALAFMKISATLALDGCTIVDLETPCFSVLATNIDQGQLMRSADCKEACRLDNFHLAYVGEAQYCFCSTDAEYSTCSIDRPQMCSDIVCTDDQPCGNNAMNTAYAVYNTGAGNTFTFNVTVESYNNLTVYIEGESDNMEYSIDLGDGSNPVLLTGFTSGRYSLASYYISDFYEVCVTSRNPGIPGLNVQFQNVSFISEDIPSEPTETICPRVKEPGVQYDCTISVNGIESDQNSGTFVETGEPDHDYEFTGIVNSLIYYGNPPPRDVEGTSGVPGATKTTMIKYTQHPLEDDYRIVAFEFYLYEEGETKIYVIRPSCSSGKVYCQALRGCASSCSYNSTEYSHTCPSKQTFCSVIQTCVTGFVKDTCPTSTKPNYNLWEELIFTAPVKKGFNRIPLSGITARQGSIIAVQGPIARREELFPGGDTIDDLQTDYHHFFAAVFQTYNRFQLSHTGVVVADSVQLQITMQSGQTFPANPTYIQRIILDLALHISEPLTDAFDPTLNVQPPFYARSGVDMNYQAIFSVAGPISLNFTSIPLAGGGNSSTDFTGDTDYPLRDSGPHQIDVPFRLNTAGEYRVVTTAENYHNTYGDIEGPIENTTTLIIQHPVADTWTVTPIPTPENAFKIPTQAAIFEFVNPSPVNFPTSPSVEITWGDGSPTETLPFVDPGDFTPVVSHQYTEGGVYRVEAYIFNKVSGHRVSCSVTIIEEIENFVVTPMYYPTDKSPNARVGYGEFKHMFPVDRRVTFFPSMSAGTVATYKITNATTGDLLLSFTTANQFEPVANSFSYKFNDEGEVTLNIAAENVFEVVNFVLFLDVVGMLRGLTVDDNSAVTLKGFIKTFRVTFLSLGRGACMSADWGDFSQSGTFGDEEICKDVFPWAAFNDEPIALDMGITHTYTKNGVYNISVLAFNAISRVNDQLMFIVSSIPCNPPKVEIRDGVLFYLQAPRLKRGDSVNLVTKASINCTITSKTKKRWQVFRVEPEFGDIMTPVLFIDTLPSSAMSEFTLPKNFLQYGYYEVVYTLAMWDPIVLDIFWPFQKDVRTFIEVVPSDLIPIIMDYAVSRVRRGITQEVTFKPEQLSIDPDFPGEKTFNVTWRCKKLDETWPDPEADQVKPVFRKGPNTQGCFGYGPGLMDTTDDELSLLGSDFVDSSESYEVMGTVQKGARSKSTFTHVVVVPYVVPILEVRCLREEFCTPVSGGIVINPSYHSDFVMKCVSDCGDAPLTYRWVVSDENDDELPYKDEYYPLGLDDVELSLSPNLHDDFPDIKKIILAGTATTSDGRTGETAFYMSVNKEPVGGTCSITHPATNRAHFDPYLLECSGWTDPEDIGIKLYTVHITDQSDGKVSTLCTFRHFNQLVQDIKMVLPPGTFKVTVKIVDKWESFTQFDVEDALKISMPAEEEFLEDNIMPPLEKLAGEGNVPMLNMKLSSLTSVMMEADWMQTSNKSKSEVNKILLTLDKHNNFGLKALLDNTNFNSLDTIEMTSSTLARIMKTASTNLDVLKSISIETRESILKLMENMIDGVNALDVVVPAQLQIIGDNIVSIASNFMLGIFEIGTDDTCSNAPPSDLRDSDNLPFDTDIGFDINMVIPESDLLIRKCNVRDVTKGRGMAQVPILESVVNKLCKAMLKRSLISESWTLSSDNGMVVETGLIRLNGTEWSLTLGDDGSRFTFPEGFCPTGKCGDPVGVIGVNWPYITHSYSDGVSNLALGTKVLDMEITDRNTTTLPIWGVKPPIVIDIPRSIGKMGKNDIPEPQFINATQQTLESVIPIVYTNFNITKVSSSFNIEITPEHDQHRLFMMVSGLKVPTLAIHDWFTLVEDIPTRRNGTYDWFVPSSEVKGTGRYFIGVGEFTPDFDVSLMADPLGNNVSLGALLNISVDYTIRSFTSGCYYFDKEKVDWKTSGLQTTYSDYNITRCGSGHLTSFGAGLFVPPNSIDFSFVFANMGFSDNLTIYLTLIISLTIFVALLIWARFMDKKDIEKLGAAPLPDNRVQDKYLYEMLVFTGNLKGAQTDSTVQFILNGVAGESDVRTLGDDRREILRKAGVDVFVMAVPRSLGDLEYLRIWHDNSGKGPNASWNLSYVVFRDVQTGEKWEFIANKWLALEKDDGMIERLFQVAGREEKTQFRHLFNTTSNKNLTDGHLWFSVFLRPPRSRFTRCQRVASCFALLFLSMLVNAMWYDTVPEQPGTGGLKLGPFSLSPEQIGVGIMSNLIVFPPSFLIVYLFRKARPSKLRKSRIQQAVERTRKEFREKSQKRAEKQEAQQRQQTNGEKANQAHFSRKLEDERKKRKKKKTLPAFFRYIAWLLVLVCIVASCFFLLMYGIMFGNSKATKWVTSLIVSFFSSVLFVQPIKIFLMALLVSAILKSGDHDEDDAEEDEEDPDLLHDEEWMHDDSLRVAKRHRRTDQEKLEQLRIIRRKELEMYEIIKEIILYAIFIWILLILSHGNRDPNAFFLQRSLRESFLYEGSLTGEDFTKVRTTDRLWYYLQNALLKKLRADVLYNGKPPYGLRGFLEDHSNRIMGYATVRQIRAKRNFCVVPHTMANITRECSSYSGILNEDKQEYCAGWLLPNNDTVNSTECNMPEFKYSTAEDLGGFPKWGQLDWYGGGGYVIHLQGPTETLLDLFNELQANHWIDTYTRAVLIEFSTYNAGVNLFGLSLIMAEYTPGGGITPSFRFEGIRLLQHHSNFGAFIIACEVIFIIFIIGYTVREIRAWYRQGSAYFKNYWSYAEIAIILASYTIMVVYLLRYVATKAVLTVFKNTFGNGYVNLSYAAFLNEIYLYLVSFICFVGTLKFIKLLRFNKRIGILSVTLRQCWDDLSGFLMAFFLCFFTFVNMFYLLLNMHLEGFYNFVTSVETCFSMMLGKFQFEKMKEASYIVPLMFFVFVLFNSWVLINLILTVVIQAFVQIKHDMLKQPNEYEIVDFVWGRFRAFIGFQGKKQATTLQDDQGDKDGERKMSHDENNERVSKFPEKVDKFLEYINSIYFDGSLDYYNKSNLRSAYYLKPIRASGVQNGDWNGPWNGESDHQRGMSGRRLGTGNGGDNRNNPLRGRSGNVPWTGNWGSLVGMPKNNTSNYWAGADGDGGYPKRFRERKNDDSKQRNNARREPVYEGPRISNKMQAELDDF